MLRVMRLLAWAAEIPALCTERQSLHHYRLQYLEFDVLVGYAKTLGIRRLSWGDSGMGRGGVEDREGGEGEGSPPSQNLLQLISQP